MIKILPPFIILDNQIESHSYIVDSSYYDLFWSSSIKKHFKETVFFCNDEVTAAENEKQLVSVVYNLSKGKIYIVKNKDFHFFLKKYFPDKKLEERKPELYYLILPFPHIEHEQLSSQLEFVNLSIAKFQIGSFRKIGNHRYRLRLPSEISFEDDYCDFIYQLKLVDIYKLYKQYCAYLSQFLKIQISIPLYKLVHPLYNLSNDEFEIIDKINSDKVSEICEEEAMNAESIADQINDENYNSVLDEWYNQAFENDADNFWNVE